MRIMIKYTQRVPSTMPYFLPDTGEGVERDTAEKQQKYPN